MDFSSCVGGGSEPFRYELQLRHLLSTTSDKALEGLSSEEKLHSLRAVFKIIILRHWNLFDSKSKNHPDFISGDLEDNETFTSGILIEYDSSIVVDSSQIAPKLSIRCRPGSLPFMHFDEIGAFLPWRPPATRYSQDVECFLYILVWITIGCEIHRKDDSEFGQSLYRWFKSEVENNMREKMYLLRHPFDSYIEDLLNFMLPKYKPFHGSLHEFWSIIKEAHREAEFTQQMRAREEHNHSALDDKKNYAGEARKARQAVLDDMISWANISHLFSDTGEAR